MWKRNNTGVLPTAEMTSSLVFFERSGVRHPIARGHTSREWVCSDVSLTRDLQTGAPLTRSAGQVLHLYLGDIGRKRRAGSHLLVGLPPCVGV